MGTAQPRTVADIMNPKLLYVRDGDTLSLARAQILRFGVTAVPVLDEDHRPVGMVSLRDVDADGRVTHVSTPVKTVLDSASIEEGARTLADAEVHHLVVVDRRGIAVGIVSAVDFVRAFVARPVEHPAAFSGY